MSQRLSISGSTLAALKSDLFASVVVFLVALPLCLGIAMASGAPPAAGIVTGIIGGLVVGSLAGSPMQVSGPAAGLTVIMWELIHEQGMERVGVIILLAGLIQIKWAWLQMGQWFRAVSPAVVHGMLTGIGILIMASQFHIMIDDTPKGSGIENLLTLPAAAWKGLLPDDDVSTNHHIAARIGLLTIAVMVIWNEFAKGCLKVVPGVLLSVVLATGVSLLWDLPVNHVAVRDNLLSVIALPSRDSLGHMFDPSVFAEALALALIASIETLLSATAVDQLHRGARTRYNRELFAQGVGNCLCGLMNALPMTGVIVRSAANVQAGAQSRVSAILHGGWLLLFVAFLPFVLRQIPTSSLGAVLVFTGLKLINIRAARDLQKHGHTELLIFGATVVTIVATNLLTGVLVGVGLAVAKLLYTTQNLRTFVVHEGQTGLVTLHLEGLATFVSLPRLATTLERVPPRAEVRIDCAALYHIDHACLTLLESWTPQHGSTGGVVHIDWDQLKLRAQHPAFPTRASRTAAA